MKTIYFALSIICYSVITSPTPAQNAHEGKVKFTKGQDENAVIAEYELPKQTIEAALRERMEKTLGSSHSEKGFLTYKGVNWVEISPDKVDVYTKVEGKGNKSTIILFISKGYDNFISSASDGDKVQKAENFLNGFMKDAVAYQLRQNIAAQEEVIRKAERALDNANDDGNRLVRDKEKIEKKIAENNSERSKLQSALDDEKKKLEDLKRQTGGQ